MACRCLHHVWYQVCFRNMVWLSRLCACLCGGWIQAAAGNTQDFAQPSAACQWATALSRACSRGTGRQSRAGKPFKSEGGLPENAQQNGSLSASIYLYQTKHLKDAASYQSSHSTHQRKKQERRYETESVHSVRGPSSAGQCSYVQLVFSTPSRLNSSDMMSWGRVKQCRRQVRPSKAIMIVTKPAAEPAPATATRAGCAL